MKYVVTRGETHRLDASSRSRLRGDFVELSDGVTHYESTGPGNGDLVVLVGGLTIPLFYWDELAKELHSRGLRTLAYSVYGRGYSDRVHARYDETLFVRQLDELTDRLGGAKPFHLIGTSMGALLAMAYLGGHVAAVESLTLVGPAGLNRPKVSPDLLLHNDFLAGFVTKRFGRRLLQGHLGHNVRDPQRAADLATMVLDAYRYEGSMYALFDTLQHLPLSGRADLFRRTSTTGVPILLIWGTEDNVTPIVHLDEARALLHPHQTHVIDDCGHMAPFERPRDVADTLLTFLTSPVDRLES